MNKKGFTIIEVVMVFLLMLGVAFFILPISMENTRQAKFISKWNEKYNQLEYTFSAITAQANGEISAKISSTKNNSDKKKAILDAIKPYMRITKEVKDDYQQKYMDGRIVNSGEMYYFNDFYYTSANEIIGIKVINPNCSNNQICALMSFDINGLKLPNTWGCDIFGIGVLSNRIEPLGKGINPDILKYNCSKQGSGVYCSYYYLIGGRFD